MSKDIKITTSTKGDAAVLTIKGDLTAVTGESLAEAYDNDSVSAAARLVLCFDKACYINSGGLAFLIDIASKGRKKKQKICVTGLSDHFQKIFHMVGLSRCMDICSSEEEAFK
jgi:anti-anti-sigma factor